MGYLVAEPSVGVEVVTTAAGKVDVAGTRYPKARVWLLADMTAVVCLPVVKTSVEGVSNGGIERRVLEGVLGSSWSEKTKLLTVNLSNGLSLTVDAKGCGCGMGAVQNAGPVAGRYTLNRVRRPEWHTVS
jgi:hypothetical protein